MSTATATNRTLVERAFADLANGDRRAFLAILADDVRWTLIGTTKWSGTYDGKDALQRELLRPLYARFANRYTHEVGRIVADGDHVVVETTGRARTNAGAVYEPTSCYLMRFADGAVKTVTEYADTDLIVNVLGHPHGTQVSAGVTERPCERSEAFTVDGWMLTDVGGTFEGEVLSTSAMIRMMELNCMALAAEWTSDDQTTVGFEVGVKHVAAATKGTTCMAHSRLCEVTTDRAFRFGVAVAEGQRTIGIGVHERRVVRRRTRRDVLSGRET